MWKCLDGRVDASKYPGGLRQALIDNKRVFVPPGSYVLDLAGFTPRADLDVLCDPQSPPMIQLPRQTTVLLDGGFGTRVSGGSWVGTDGAKRHLVRIASLAANEIVPHLSITDASFSRCGPATWDQQSAWNGCVLRELRLEGLDIADADEPVFFQAGAIIEATLKRISVANARGHGIVVRPHTKAAQDACERATVADVTVSGVTPSDLRDDGYNHGLRIDGRCVVVEHATVTDMLPLRPNGFGGLEQFEGVNGFYSKSKNLLVRGLTVVDAGDDGDGSVVLKGAGPGNAQGGPRGANMVFEGVTIRQTVGRPPGMAKDLKIAGILIAAWNTHVRDVRTEGLGSAAYRVGANATYNPDDGNLREIHTIDGWSDVGTRRPSTVPCFSFRGHRGAGTGGATRYEVTRASTTGALPQRILDGPIDLVKSACSW